MPPKAPALALYPYQRQWLADKSRFKIGMFARQTGKTFVTTLEIVDDCFQAESEGKRARWVILSRGERQAREAMETGVKLHVEAYGVSCQVIEGRELFGEIEVNKLEVVFPGGSRITALPANPDTARGFSANVFLDEFAFHKDSHAIWRALFPVTRKGYRMIVTSTPNGKGNKFYELMTSDALASVWSRHAVDIHRAVADGLPLDIAEFKAAMNDDDLHKLKKITGPTGTPRFVAESDSAGHADRTWALFLALNAASGVGGVCTGFESVSRRPAGKVDDAGHRSRRMF